MAVRTRSSNSTFHALYIRLSLAFRHRYLFLCSILFSILFIPFFSLSLFLAVIRLFRDSPHMSPNTLGNQCIGRPMLPASLWLPCVTHLYIVIARCLTRNQNFPRLDSYTPPVLALERYHQLLDREWRGSGVHILPSTFLRFFYYSL